MGIYRNEAAGLQIDSRNPSQSVVPLRIALIAADEPVASASFGNY